jgi:hypothetical protein
MTSRERLEATLRGDATDRVPVWAWGVHPWLGPVDPTIQPVVDAYLERGDLIHWWGPDAGTFLTASKHVTVTTEVRPSVYPAFEDYVATYMTPAGPLTRVTAVSLEGKPSRCTKYLIESEGDVDRLLSVPYVPPRPDCAGLFEVDAALGDRGITAVALPPDPVYFFNDITGSETFALWSVEKRDLIDRVVGVFLERTLDFLEWLVSQRVGPLFFYVGPELCIPPLQSPRDFEEWVVGPDRQMIDLVHAAGGQMFVHCHGRMGPVLEGFVRMGVDMLHPIEPPPMGDVTMVEAKRRVGSDLCIAGNLQEHDIHTMPTDHFRALVEETVQAGMVGGRYILTATATPFGWPTLSDLARENWLAMLDVGLQVGRY